jgi:predicted transcriptional regulator
MSTIREEVHKLADQLPADANWDDAMYALYVRMKVAEGEQDIAEGRVLDQEEVERRTAKWLAV